MNTIANNKHARTERQHQGIPRRCGFATHLCSGVHDGVTLLEVILAIAVILAGLVGITALVPIAGRNAQTTMELDRSVSESTSAASTSAIRSLHDLDALVIMDKPVTASVYGGSGTYLPSGALQTVRWKVERQGNNHPPVAGDAFSAPPVVRVGKLESPGFMHIPPDSGLAAGICIDPIGFPDLGNDDQFVFNPGVQLPFVAPNVNDNAFDPSRFPYYSERYNPVTAPNQAIGTPAVWSLAPRMWRATIKAPMYANRPAPVGRHQLLSATAARTVFQSSGGLSPFGASSDDNPQSMLVSRSNIGGNLVDSASDSSSEYSWFATLAPPFLGGNVFRQSIVVVRQRVPPVPQRLGDPLALQKEAYAIEDPEDNPASERVTWIDPTTAIGFDGGTGGEVTIYGSQAVDDDVVPNQWVMLSTQPHRFSSGPGTWNATGPAVHRWFRVIRVGEAEVFNALPFMGNNYPVWRRQLTLLGPDWTFHSGAPDPRDDTFCTIISGAISVTESEVEVR